MADHRIEIAGWSSPVRAGRGTILDAALDAGIPAPHQCRAGECGDCKCKLISGTVKSGPYLSDALSQQDAADGWVLACRSTPTSDIAIRFAQPLRTELPKPQRQKAKIHTIDPVCRDVIRVELVCPKPTEFLPGQYFQLEFDGLPPRSFSPANLPGGRDLEFFVKVHPRGQVSGYLRDGAELGETVKVKGPFGTACLSAPPAGPVLLAGGGTGLAPMMSMLRHLSVQAPDTKIRFYAGARSRADLFEQGTIARLAAALPNLELHWVLSEDNAPGCRTGHIAPVVEADCDALSEYDVYLAGPPPMVDSVAATVSALGADKNRVFSDPFTPPSEERQPARIGFLRRMFKTA